MLKYKTGMTIFEVLLYVGLLSVLLGIVSAISIQSFKVLSESRTEVAIFKINYYIEASVRYLADSAVQISVSTDVITNTDTIIFSYANSPQKILRPGDIQRIVRSVGDIEDIHYQYDPVLKICRVTYMFVSQSCPPPTAGPNCEKHLEINLL